MESETPRYYEFGGYRLDQRRRVLENAAGELIGLSARAFDTLVFFLQNPGTVIDRETLLKAVWPGAIVDENNLSQAVTALRRALGSGVILTVARQGYQFTAEIRTTDDASVSVSARACDEAEPELSAAAESAKDHDESAAESVIVAGKAFSRQSARRFVRVFAVACLIALILTFIVSINRMAVSPGRDATGSLATGQDVTPAGIAVRALPRVAVLPCENFGPDPDGPLSASAFHVELLSRLSDLSGLVVVPRSAVLSYAESGVPISQMADELDVAGVMECSVRSDSGRVVVTASFIDPVSSSTVWSEQYGSDSWDVGRIIEAQADIASNIAGRLQADIPASELRRIESVPTDSYAAYAHFIQAQSLVYESGTSEAYFAHLDQAIEADPDFALAYIERASGHMGRVGLANISPAAGIDVGAELGLLRRDAERALAIDPDLGRPHALLAAFHVYSGDMDSAAAHVSRALQLAPNDRLVLGGGAFLYFMEGRRAEARELLDRYAQLDSASAGGVFFYVDAYFFYLAGDLGAAAERARRIVQSNPASGIARADLGYYEALRGSDAAERELRLADGLEASFPNVGRPGFLARLTYSYHRIGLHDDAEEAFDRLLRALGDDRQLDLNPVEWMLAYLGIGKVEEALDWAARAASSPLPPGPVPQLELMLNAFEDPVLERPEFLELRRKLGYQDPGI